jgi:membrane-associated phospholipid phosphatase
LKGDLVPEGCRWCDDNALDAGARDLMRWDDQELPATISDVGAFVLVPGAAIGLTVWAAGREGRADWRDVLVILEAGIIAADLNQLTKFLARRERPFVHALPPEDKPLTPNPDDNNLSFYSGHASFTVALAVAGGTVASARGLRWARWVWIAGLGAAATTSYLRIAADKHWLSDVLVGGATGAAIGWLVPTLHRKPGLPVVSVALAPGGGVVGAAWRF